MSEITPFAHPVDGHPRRHAPAGYASYRDFKPWLRDEFLFRCVYCLERERWYPSGSDAFSIDHVLPKVSHPERIRDYENLVYACSRCNARKQDCTLADPTEVGLGTCVSIDPATGVARPLNDDGEELIERLHLNEDELVATRLEILSLIPLKAEFPDHPVVHRLYMSTFAYPDDLPDLESLRPPGGNRPKAGRSPSHYKRRQMGRLAAAY